MRRGCARGRIKLGLAALMALAAAEAYAGAWTEPAGQGQMIASLYGWQGNGRRGAVRRAASARPRRKRRSTWTTALTIG